MSLRVERTNFLFGLLAVVGILQFSGAVYVAIHNYPAASDGAASGYRLGSHFLSDLGCTKTTEGLSNSTSAVIFNRSVIVLGLALLPFFHVLSLVSAQCCWLVRGCGLLSAVGLVGIGLTPYDVHFTAHHVALVLWLLPMLIAMAAYFLDAAWRQEASSALGVATSLVLVAALGYAVVGSHDGYVVLQKLLSVLAICWFVLVFMSVSFATIQSISTRRQLVEWQAEQFLHVLARGHRKPVGRRN